MGTPFSFCEHRCYDYKKGKRYESLYIDISKYCCSEMSSKKEEENRFESPMPWIGLYVAAASLVCSLAMAADVFHGFRHRKLWFPCKFFTLNAASLTLLAVATKLPVDLSTNMPTTVDQLAKLSSTILMSTAIGNFMPSLGAMDDKDILMNMVALAILVITISVNICIQLSTQAINHFYMIEHIAALSFMLVLLVIMSFSILTVSTTKKHLQLNYDDMHEMISSEESKETQKFTIEKLKENVKKYWMMAETGSPQFVMARSVTCYASGTICFLSAVTLAEANLKIILISADSLYTAYKLYNDYKPVNVGSSYRWSTFVVLVIQSFGVAVGTIAPTFRAFTTLRLRFSQEKLRSYKIELKIENCWIERLARWRESPLPFRVRGKKCRKIVHKTKNLILDFFTRVQTVIVLASKLILLISIFLVSSFLSFGHYYKLLKQKLISTSTASNNHTGSESVPGTKLDLSRYVLFLEGEEKLPLQLVKKNRNATNHFIHKGKKQQPQYLKELLDKSSTFDGVAKFDSDKVPSLDSEEPPNCWSLPVVTLTSIAIALPNIDNHKVNWLLQSVREGLLYVSLVEKIWDAKGDLVSIRNAADTVWLEVDLSHKWLDEDLRKIALEVKTSKETLEKIVDISKITVTKFKENMNGNQKKNPLSWHIKAIAANSIYRISQTMLLGLEGGNNQTNEGLFDQLSVMIADILGACLTNFPRVITVKCFCSAIEMRERSVQHAAHLLGETEDILKILQRHDLPCLNPDEAAYIDEWRALMKLRTPLAFISSSTNGISSGSGKLQIAIE